jgi:hypothetical protein
MGRRLLAAALCAAACTLGSPAVGPAAAQSSPDEVSAQIASLFSTYAQEYQQIQAQSAALHDSFVNMLQGVGGTPGHPIGGICDAGLSFVAAAHLAIGPLHNCGPLPPNPSPFLSATEHLANRLSAAVLAQTTTMQNLFGTTALTAQQFQSFDPASVPASMFTTFLGQQATVTATFANALQLTTQMSHVVGSLDARFDLYATWFGKGGGPPGPPGLRAKPVAHAAWFAPRTRAEAWAGLVELNAELRAILHGPGALPTHLELPAQAHLPVSVVACEQEHCSIDVQAVLTVGGEETPLPGQQLRLDSGEKAILRVELRHDQLAALHAHSGGRLAVTIGSDGHARTLHVRLTA